jgi:hypothetical protein
MRVTFLYLEYEDLIAVLLIAPVSFFLGSLFDRELLGIPIKIVMQWGIPAVTIVLLLTFKYGKPRGYLRDWWTYATKPHVYCGLERDSQITVPYLKDGDGE